jgi:hypothetical protein
MYITIENIENIGSLFITTSSLSTTMYDGFTNTINISKFNIEYSQNITRSSVQLQDSPVNMVYTQS